MKHGLTGAGIILPGEDAVELDRRLAAYEAELCPTTEVERDLIRRVALASLRLGRAAEQEAMAIGYRMRHSLADFDEARKAEAELLMAWIASTPETNARRLRQSPEGLTLVLEAVEALRSDLAHPSGFRWDYQHDDRLHHLVGRRYVDVPYTRIRALTEAIHGKFQHLEAHDGAGLETDDRRRWAIAELVDLMDDEIAALKKQLEGFDREALERDRAEAPGRAMFDDSKEAILARKYEAASERSMFKALDALKELRKEAAQAAAKEEVATQPTEELGSFFPEPAEDSIDQVDVDPASPTEPPPSPRKRPDPSKISRKGRRRGGKS